MNKGQNIFSKKISGSTLTEVIVALAIITITSAIFFAIIIKAGNYHYNRRKIIIHKQITSIANDTRLQKQFENKTYNFENYYIVTDVLPHKGIDNTKHIKLIAYDMAGNIIIEHNAIVTQR